MPDNVTRDTDGTSRRYEDRSGVKTQIVGLDTNPGGTTEWLTGTPETIGVAGAAFSSADQSGAAAAVTDAPGAGLKLVLVDLLVSVGATALKVDFTEETSGTLILSLHLAANSTHHFAPKGKLKLATANKKLMVQTSAAGAVRVTALYHPEA